MKATRKCSFCGKSFVTRSGMQRYCSEACQAEAKRARVMQKNNLFKVAQPLMEIQHQEYLTFSKAAILMGCSHLQTCSHRQAESLTHQQPHGIHPQSRHRADVGGQSLSPHPARQHLHTKEIIFIFLTCQKRKKGKGKRRSVGLLFGRGGDVPF